jgi:hypothetical protein
MKEKTQALENIRLGHSRLSDKVYAGYMDKSNRRWTKKKDITSDFLGAVIARFEGRKETITTSDGEEYEITVRKMK